jgi:hypothetical protein
VKIGTPITTVQTKRGTRMKREDEMLRKAYWSLVQSAMRDRKIPKEKQQAERWLLRFAPHPKDPQ